jgi:hypothetical protein
MCTSRSALFALLTLLPLSASAEWLEFGAGCPEGSEPLTFHDITLDDLIAFDVEMQGLLADTVVHDSIPYLRFSRSPGTAPMDSTGYPELPVVVCFVVMPDESDLELSYSAECMESMGCLPVYPAPLDSLVSDSAGTPYITEFFRKDSTAYASEEWYPEELAEIVGEFHLRDQRVAIVSVHPVQYLASGDSLRVWSDIECSILFTGQDPEWNEAGLGYYDLLVGDILLGYHPDYEPIDAPSPSVVRHEDTTEEPSIDPDYVILVANGLDGTWIDGFARYRRDLNRFDVLIANLDDVMTGYGGSSPYPTADIIRDYTEALWAWSPAGERPTYLLLIGDHETSNSSGSWLLPAFEDTTWGGTGNDSWYVYFGDSREIPWSFPDMIVGRLPARDADELENMLALIEDYEAPVQTPGPSARRHLIRLAGSDYQGETTPPLTCDEWEPSVTWTESLKDWLGYTWDNHYCGDGEDGPGPGGGSSNPDGSRMTSAEWVQACRDAFEHGAQVAFYSDHGDFHMFSAGLNWEEEGPPNFGVPDSSFDNLDVLGLSPASQDFCHPFVLMLCCSAGTFSHDEDEHPEVNDYSGLCEGTDAHLHPYDFTTDCLAEAFMRNTEGGAIGVFAGSNSSLIDCYKHYGEGILEALFERGITRMGDAVLYARMTRAGQFVGSTGWDQEMGQFNLLGDPAVDIGDRVKFRRCCDIIISPADLEINRYPTRDIAGLGEVILIVTMRNAGAQRADAFTVDLEITDGIHLPDVITRRSAGLAAGEERTLKFAWTTHSWFAPPGTLTLTATADDPGGEHPDSWTGNNSATSDVWVQDFYPNEPGWPARTVGSVKSPPTLVDAVGDSDLEILVIEGSWFLSLYDAEDASAPIWRTVLRANHLFELGGGYTIPAVADVCGSSRPEAIIDCREGGASPHALRILDLGTGEILYEYGHPSLFEQQGSHPNTVAIGDVIPDHEGNEIVFVNREESTHVRLLQILGVGDQSIELLDEAELPLGAVSSAAWVSVADITEDQSSEVVVSYQYGLGANSHSGTWVYDWDDSSQTSGFITSATWNDNTFLPGIHAVGMLPSGMRVALSRGMNVYHDRTPALILDPDSMNDPDECVQSIETSSNILCCIMADWVSPPGQADRILANAENQCFAWEDDGNPITNYPVSYTATGSTRPPFPALGNLDDDGVADLLAATREGSVMAYDADGAPLESIGFPYSLPASIYGGFAVADIDNDGYVEVVFGTMDNYLHVWELGECEEGYAPWPQCQHDAARTGVLLEE